MPDLPDAPTLRARHARRADRWLWPIAALAGALFFLSLGRLWPLPDVDLTAPRAGLRERAGAVLVAQGVVPAPRADALAPGGRYRSATRLAVDEAALAYVERTFGRPVAEALVASGAGLVAYDVLYRAAGDPDGLAVTLLPDGRPLGWSRGVQDDAAGARLPVDSARALARRALATGLGVPTPAPAPPGATSLAGDVVSSVVGFAEGNVDGRADDARRAEARELGPPLPDAARRAVARRLWQRSEWAEAGASSRERPRRLDHTFTYERVVHGDPELRERAVAVVSGAAVTYARRTLVVPAAGERAARARAAPERALQTLGFALLVVAAIGALAVFLTRLRDGRVRLARAAWGSAVVFVCAFLTNALADFDLLAAWDPLWPRWVATLARLSGLAGETAWTFVVLFALVAAGDALDREGRSDDQPVRGRTLWRLGRGRLGDAAVGAASARGFAVGLVCGGVMAAAVWMLERLAGARVGLQPTGFFFMGLNAGAPSIATLLFFTNVALLEELGYRLFGGLWLLRATGRAWLAVALPALVYGLTHTGLSFLPPAEPFWGRALVMTLVGCVWGWAFLRWDALTVVTSHLTADLFIFNWPRLASAHADVRWAALATVAAPLVPALVAGAAWALGRTRIRRRAWPPERAAG